MRREWALSLVATFTMAISYVDRQTLSVLAPTVTKALKLGDTQYGLLASAFSIAYLVGAPAAGWVIDRVGARRGLLASVLVWSLVAALHALVPGFAALFMLRIALGLAEAPSFPGAAQTVHRALPPDERARGLGILFTGSSIGAMIAAPLSTQLEARIGFRLAFVGVALVGLVWVPLWFALAWSAEGRAVLDREEETRVAAPPVREVVFHPAVLRALVAVVASAPTIAFALLWGSKFLTARYGITQTAVGKYLWFPPLLFDLGAVFFGDRAARRRDGRSPRLLFGIAALLALTVVIGRFAPGPWTAVVTLGFALAGGGALFALLTADMLARVPPSAVSLAGGCTAAAQSLAYVVANPLIGRSVDAHHGYDRVLLALAMWTIPGCLVWLLWPAPPRWEHAATTR